MTNTLGIVEVPPAYPTTQANTASTATSHGSLAARRFGGKSLLEWVVRRVTESLLLDQVLIVCDGSQEETVQKLAPANVRVWVGKEPDALARFAAATREFQATHLVRVPLGCPFVDPELIDRLVCTAIGNPGFDYIGYFFVDGRPAVLSKVGLFAEWCDARALHVAESRACSSEDRAEPTRYIYSHPEEFQLRFIPVPARLDRKDVRLTVDVEEDWEHAQLIFEALGPESLDWRHIAALLDRQPALRERMAMLNESELRTAR